MYAVRFNHISILDWFTPECPTASPRLVAKLLSGRRPCTSFPGPGAKVRSLVQGLTWEDEARSTDHLLFYLSEYPTSDDADNADDEEDANDDAEITTQCDHGSECFETFSSLETWSSQSVTARASFLQVAGTFRPRLAVQSPCRLMVIFVAQVENGNWQNPT